MNYPCRIEEISYYNTTECFRWRIVGIDIITDKKHSETFKAFHGPSIFDYPYILKITEEKIQEMVMIEKWKQKYLNILK